MIKSVSLGGAGSAVAAMLLSAATNATPVVATIGANSGLKISDRIAIAGITGNTGANGHWSVSPASALTLTLPGSVGNGAYAGTPRVALLFDTTPLMKGHSALLTLGGNFVGTLLLEAFDSFEEFAAGDNSRLGVVKAPVLSSMFAGVTNVNSSAASAATIASSSIVVGAALESQPFEIVLPRYLRVSASAWTSGSITGLISA